VVLLVLELCSRHTAGGGMEWDGTSGIAWLLHCISLAEPGSFARTLQLLLLERLRALAEGLQHRGDGFLKGQADGLG
jgi:hypothetical protein